MSRNFIPQPPQQMKPRPRISLLGLCGPAVVGLAVFAAGAQTPTPAAAQQTAIQYLENQHQVVNRLLRQPARTEAARRQRSERLTRLLSDLLAYDTLCRNALGDHWNEHNAQERSEFVSLLRQLVERNYENNLERILEYEVSYDSEARRGDSTLVRTSARSRSQRRQPPVVIEYTMQQTDAGWRVVDVTTDGVSMVQNYRRQFHRIIDRDGWSELIGRMRRRLEEGAG